MASRRVFIAYDFLIKTALTNDFEFAKEELHPDIELEWPGSADAARQGEIWRNLVRPQLETATQFVAYLDLPNANVGFEVGYALGYGEGKKAALARVLPELPVWLNRPPLKGMYCEQMLNGEALVEQIRSNHWIESPKPPAVGSAVLVLCPPVSGKNYIGRVRAQHSDWRVLPEDGWSIADLPRLLDGIGAVVWLILAHREGQEARDGSENAAASVVAGYAHACRMHLRVIAHSDARAVVDVASQALEFSRTEELLEHLKAVHAELQGLMQPQTAEVTTPQSRSEPPRPDVGPLPELSTAGLRERFIGRMRLLGDFTDAMRGLDLRRRGEPAQGAAKVQAIWYHGFGGMGKSWFLRRAIIEAQDRWPAVKVALVDWDQPTWRVPLSQPPESPRELLEPIARRLAQIYGVAALDPYWNIEQRMRDAEPEASRLRERFQQMLLAIQEGKEGDNILLQVLADKNVAAEGTGRSEELRRLRLDRIRREEVFAAWLENGGASAADRDAILRPDALRVAALQDCARRLAITAAPLLLLLDTCEVMATDLEQWLRQLVAPLCDGRTPFLALFGSRLAPDIAEPPGSRTVWRAAVGEERWRTEAFNEGWRFTVDEIGLAVQHLEPPIADPESLAERLHRVTLGVPLALRSLIDLHEAGDDILVRLGDVELPDESEAAEAAEAHVAEIVADRFLLHLANRRDREDDFRKVIALALLHESNRDLLRTLWRTDNVTGPLRELARRYSLLSVGDLHSTVRSFLRRRWRSDDRPPLVSAMIAELRAAADAVELPGLPGEADYVKALAVQLNALGWDAPSEALTRSAPALAVSLAFDEQVPLLVGLAAEVPAGGGSARTSKALVLLATQLRSGASTVPPWGSDDVFAWLEREEEKGRWRAEETAALQLLRGLRLAARGERDASLAPLLKALAAFGARESPPRAGRFGEALFEAAYALRLERGREADAVAGFRGARALKHLPSASANNAGALLKRLGKSDDAEALYLEAIETEPTEPLYPRNLGNLRLGQRRYEEAETWYRRALEIDPAYAPAHDGLGFLHKAREQYDEAANEFRLAMALNPKDPTYPDNLGDMLRVRKEFDEADAAYRAAIELDATYAPAHNGLGLLLRSRERYEEAADEFRQAMALDHDEPIYADNLGDLLLEREQFDEAEAAYRAATERDAKYAPAHNGLALTLKRRERHEAAAAAFRQAMALDPKEPIYPTNLGDLLREREQVDEAEAAYRTAIEADAKYARAHNGLGLLLKRRERYEEAAGEFRQAMALDPKEPIYPTNLGDVLAEREQVDEAEAAYRAAIEVNANYARAHNGLGLLLMGRERYEEAADEFRSAMTLDPKEPIYPTNLGDLWREREQFDEAEAAYRTAIGVDAKWVPAHNRLGLLLKSRTRYEEAVAEFHQAIALDPTQPIYPDNLGDILYEQGKPDEAIAAYRSAIRIGPSYAEARNSLAWLLYTRSDALDEAEELARQAVTLSREPAYLHTLAAITVRRHGWPAASASLLDWMHASDAAFVTDGRGDVIALLKELLARADPASVAATLRAAALGDHWGIWIAAIEHLADPRQPASDDVRTIAGELTQP